MMNNNIGRNCEELNNKDLNKVVGGIVFPEPHLELVTLRIFDSAKHADVKDISLDVKDAQFIE